jgi:hypothetical protein
MMFLYTWASNIVFSYARKLAKKTTKTELDDNTVNILEQHTRSLLSGECTPADAGMRFIAAELQMLIDHARKNKKDSKLWKYLAQVQKIVGSLEIDK